MLRPGLLSGLLLASLAGPVLAEGLTPILRLELREDDTVVRSATLLASDIDPNSRSAKGPFHLTIDGEAVDLPDTTVQRLDTGRRAYSYDGLSGGIRSEASQALCRMAGPSRGWMLSALYLTYADGQIAGAEMRDILSEADNCLFTHAVHPEDPDARRAAMAHLATLKTLIELQGD